VHAELTKQFDRYQQALIENDVKVLNELFWDNALTIRYGVGENLYEHAAIATYRHTRDPQGLVRVVGTSVVTTYGHDAATTNIEFTRAGRTGPAPSRRRSAPPPASAYERRGAGGQADAATSLQFRAREKKTGVVLSAWR
jgi:hypothetical protein